MGFPTGRRYCEQASNGCRFLLFVREQAGDAFTCLGPVSYVSHTGSRPMSITWRLLHPIPAEQLRPGILLGLTATPERTDGRIV